MGKIAEIIQSGVAPGFGGRALDPQSAEVAVPRAFKQLEQTHSASKISRDAGFPVDYIKRAWNFKQTL